MGDINAKVNEAFVSQVIQNLDGAYVKMDEARIWARRQVFFLSGGVVAAATAESVDSGALSMLLWVVVCLSIVATVALELGKYTDADAEASEKFQDAMTMIEFVPRESTCDE